MRNRTLRKPTPEQKNFNVQLRAAARRNRIIAGKDGKLRDQDGKFVGKDMGVAVRRAAGMNLPADEEEPADATN